MPYPKLTRDVVLSILNKGFVCFDGDDWEPDTAKCSTQWCKRKVNSTLMGVPVCKVCRLKVLQHWTKEMPLPRVQFDAFKREMDQRRERRKRSVARR